MRKKITAEAEQRIRDIADRLNGRPTPDHLTEDAKDPESPLHAYYEWDVNKCAEWCWAETSRALLRVVELEVTTEERTFHARAYPHDPTGGDNRKQSYRELSLYETDEDKYATVAYRLSQMIGHLKNTIDIAEAMALEKRNVTKLRQAQSLIESVHGACTQNTQPEELPMAADSGRSNGRAKAAKPKAKNRSRSRRKETARA